MWLVVNNKILVNYWKYLTKMYKFEIFCKITWNNSSTGERTVEQQLKHNWSPSDFLVYFVACIKSQRHSYSVTSYSKCPLSLSLSVSFFLSLSDDVRNSSVLLLASSPSGPQKREAQQCSHDAHPLTNPQHRNTHTHATLLQSKSQDPAVAPT